MKTRLLIAILLITCFEKANSQVNDSIKTGISHIFFCIDSVSYNNLFNHEFIAKLFANTSESSGKTLTDSWTGKYLNGRQSYLEVFEPNETKEHPQLGDKFGDIGLVFRTNKPGDIQKIEARIKGDKIETQLELMKYESDGKIIPFNYNLYLSMPSLQESFRPYVEEFTVDFLTLRGFTNTEIKAGVTEEQFREKRRGKKYEKLYDNIEKVELALTGEEFASLSGLLKYIGFSQTGNRFTNNGLEIQCSVEENRPYKLKAIYFSLLKESKNISIEISKNLSFNATGSKASFQFNYQ
jgi:hypothetical protein